jgi:hypothetical protein
MKEKLRVPTFDGYVVFFLLSLLDWPIILIAGLGTWFWGRSWAAILAFCVSAPVVQAALAAFAHHSADHRRMIGGLVSRACAYCGMRSLMWRKFPPWPPNRF